MQNTKNVALCRENIVSTLNMEGEAGGLLSISFRLESIDILSVKCYTKHASKVGTLISHIFVSHCSFGRMIYRNM